MLRDWLRRHLGRLQNHDRSPSYDGIAKHVRDILRTRTEEKRIRVNEERWLALQAEEKIARRIRTEEEIRRHKLQMIRSLHRNLRRMRIALLPRILLLIYREQRTTTIVRLIRIPSVTKECAFAVEPEETAAGWRFRISPPNWPVRWVFPAQGGLSTQELLTYLAERAADVLNRDEGRLGTRIPTPQPRRGGGGELEEALKFLFGLPVWLFGVGIFLFLGYVCVMAALKFIAWAIQ
jgi:hypothetical protein